MSHLIIKPNFVFPTSLFNPSPSRVYPDQVCDRLCSFNSPNWDDPVLYFAVRLCNRKTPSWCGHCWTGGHEAEEDGHEKEWTQ